MIFSVKYTNKRNDSFYWDTFFVKANRTEVAYFDIPLTYLHYVSKHINLSNYISLYIKHMKT